VFEVVLRIAKYALYPLRKFLLPLVHVRQLVLVSDQPFQHPLCGGGKRVDRNRIAVIKPKKYCCRELASSNEFFANDNCVRWSEFIVRAAHPNSIRTMCVRSPQAADQAGGQSLIAITPPLRDPLDQTRGGSFFLWVANVSDTDTLRHGLRSLEVTGRMITDRRCCNSQTRSRDSFGRTKDLSASSSDNPSGDNGPQDKAILAFRRFQTARASVEHSLQSTVYSQPVILQHFRCALHRST